MDDMFEFAKMHGAGNDFIMIDDRRKRFDDSPELIAALCEQHRGIGADGLILIRDSGNADFRMRYFNRDGGEAEMCGNGARCAALFALEQGVAKEKMSFETGAGTVDAEVLERGVRIGIGEVRGLRLGLALVDNISEIHFAISGVPHAVAIVDDTRGFSEDDFIRTARVVRYHTEFAPNGANFNLAQVLGRNKLAYRTYERGVEAETQACGTGAVAVAVITSHLGLTESPVTCETSGGDSLVIDFERTGDGAGNCRLTGPAVVAFTGSFRIGDYR
jgi:diaminopimelate epimerase